jgi:hypothetical protein
MAEFFSLCAQYSHFIIQTENLAKQLKQRSYEPWQQFSWQEMRCLPIIAVVLEKQDSQSELSTQITVELASGYKVSGTRVDILRVFSMFYLELMVIGNNIEPSLTLSEAIDLEIKAVLQAAENRSEIVGDSDLSAVAIQVRSVWAKEPAYLQKLRRVIKGIQEKAGEFTDQ